MAGRSGAASIQGQLLNMKEGGFISEYDMHIGSQIAWVITGGDVDPGTVVDEQWLLDLERTVFVDLLKNEKTLERHRKHDVHRQTAAQLINRPSETNQAVGRMLESDICPQGQSDDSRMCGASPAFG